MRFLLDESINFPAAIHLRNHGHDVTTVIVDYGRGLKDREVLAIAYREQRIVITNDRDFGELAIRLALPHAGIVLFRLESEDRTSKLAWLDYLVGVYAEELHNVVVVTTRGVRIHRT